MERPFLVTLLITFSKVSSRYIRSKSWAEERIHFRGWGWHEQFLTVTKNLCRCVYQFLLWLYMWMCEDLSINIKICALSICVFQCLYVCSHSWESRYILCVYVCVSPYCVTPSPAGCRRKHARRLLGCKWWGRADDTETPHPWSSPCSLVWTFLGSPQNSLGRLPYCTPEIQTHIIDCDYKDQLQTDGKLVRPHFNAWNYLH